MLTAMAHDLSELTDGATSSEPEVGLRSVAALRLLLDRLERVDGPRHDVLPTELIERATTGSLTPVRGTWKGAAASAFTVAPGIASAPPGELRN